MPRGVKHRTTEEEKLTLAPNYISQLAEMWRLASIQCVSEVVSEALYVPLPAALAHPQVLQTLEGRDFGEGEGSAEGW